MTWKSKDRYWTLFCPKYCAASGAAPASASAATAAAIRRMGIILSTRRPACPRRAPEHRPTAARAGRIPAAQGGTHAPRNLRSRATPTAPAPALPHDAVRGRAAPALSPNAPPSPHVGVGRPGNDYEVVGGGAESPQVQYQRINRLAIEQRLGHELQRRPHVHDGPLRRATTPAPASHSAALIRLFRPRLGRTRPT